jgi:hypothetical protein
MYVSAFVTFIRGTRLPLHSTVDNALDFICARPGFYGDGSDRRTKERELRALGNLVSPEINLEPRVTNTGRTATVFCPTSKREAIVRIVGMKSEIGEDATLAQS